MSVTPWPASRSCAVCSESFFPKSTVQLYCSARCRERAKYLRVRNDPERWAAYLAAERAAYQPTGRPPGLPPKYVGCAVEGCEDKHLARGFCRKHYRRDRYRRGLDRRGVNTDLVSALVKHYDEAGDFIDQPTQTRLAVKIGGGLLVPECPGCGRPMFKVPVEEADLRDCAACRTRALLNSEEVSWLTSEEHSIERSRRIRNSSTT